MKKPDAAEVSVELVAAAVHAESDTDFVLYCVERIKEHVEDLSDAAAVIGALAKLGSMMIKLWADEVHADQEELLSNIAVAVAMYNPPES